MESREERGLEALFNNEENQMEINISQQSQSSIIPESFSNIEKKSDFSKEITIKDIETKLTENFDYFHCNKCNITPLIDFKNGDIDNAIFSCKCEGQKNIKITIIDLIKEYKHSTYKKGNFTYYCEKCDLNLDIEAAKSHENQYLINLLSEQNKTNEKLDIIKYALELNNENFIGKNKSFDNLREFVKILIYHFNYSPNYNLIQDIKNIYYLDLIQKTKIISVNELYEKRNFDEVKIIKITFSNCYNLETFGKHILNNLIEINLYNNNIDDINQLIFYNFENLEILNFTYNKLGEENIKYLKEIKAPKLKKLILSNNNFTDYELFYAIQHFELLEKLDLCSNRFYKGCDKIYKEKKWCDLSSIVEIVLYNGVFSDENIKLLEWFKLDNMKILHLNGNNLTNLSFLLKINWNSLEEIYLNNNEINEIEIKEISQLKNLKKIELGNNIISEDKIEELENYFIKNNIEYNLRYKSFYLK